MHYKYLYILIYAMYRHSKYMYLHHKNFVCRVGDGTVLYIHGSFVMHKIPVRPIYVTVSNLNSVVSGKGSAWSVLGMMPGYVANTSIRVSSQMNLVCSGAFLLFVTACWTPCHSNVVGLRIQDCTSCPELAANQAG